MIRTVVIAALLVAGVAGVAGADTIVWTSWSSDRRNPLNWPSRHFQRVRRVAPPTLDVATGLPFTRAELLRALDERGARAPKTGRIVVGRGEGQAVLVRYAGISRVVDLGGRAGADAARVVAVAVDDAVTTQIANNPGGDAALADAPPSTTQVALLAEVITDADALRPPALGLRADYTVVHGHFIVGVDATFAQSAEMVLDDGAAYSYWFTSARLMLGAGTRRASIRAGAMLAFEGLRGVEEGTDLDLALSVEARVLIPTGGRGAIPLFVSYERYASYDEAYTPPTTVSVGFGFGWEL